MKSPPSSRTQPRRHAHAPRGEGRAPGIAAQVPAPPRPAGHCWAAAAQQRRSLGHREPALGRRGGGEPRSGAAGSSPCGAPRITRNCVLLPRRERGFYQRTNLLLALLSKLIPWTLEKTGFFSEPWHRQKGEGDHLLGGRNGRMGEMPGIVLLVTVSCHLLHC